MHQLSRLLPPDDGQYVQQASTPAVQQQRLLARAFLRCTLAQYLQDTHPRQVSTIYVTVDVAYQTSYFPLGVVCGRHPKCHLF